MPGKALVVGATGFLGSALTSRLLREDWEVSYFRFAHLPPEPESQLEGATPLEAASGRTGHIWQALGDLAPEVVFHLAAAGVNPEDREPTQLLDGNLNLIHAVLGALAERPPAAFVYTGSCSEYAPADPPRRLSEDDPVLPPDLYGAAKAATTLWATALARHFGIPLVALRLFHFYGPGEPARRLVPSLIHGLRTGQPVPLTPGEQVRDLLFVEDVIGALLAAATERVPPYQVYNVCSSTPVRVRELAELTARLMRKPLDLLEFGSLPYRPDDQMWMVGDNRRFRSLTGWRPGWDLEAGLARTIRELSFVP
jgi:nucleoside-diphosphate-sugar epimerase